MENAYHILLTLIVAFCFGSVFSKLKVKGGMLIGAIIGVASFSVVFDIATALPFSKLIAQVIAGAFIGASLKKEDVKLIPSIIAALVIMFGVYLVQNIVLGYVIVRGTDFDLATTLLSIVPGGMSTIPLIAEDFGANASYVAIMQFVRMISTITLYPIIIDRFTKTEFNSEEIIAETKVKESSVTRTALSLVVAFIGGGIGFYLGIPAGVMIFSMLFVGATQIATGKVEMDSKVKKLAQLLSGTYIGSMFTSRDLAMLTQLIVPIIILLIGYLISTVVIAFLYRRILKMTLRESLLSAMPAGASDIALISNDLGVFESKVIVIQVLRLIVVILVYPIIIAFLIN